MMKRYFWSLLQKTMEFFGRFSKKGAAVLMFHNVGDRVETGDDENIFINSASFEEFIHSLKQSGVAFERIENLEKAIENNAVVLTFDDVFGSAYENALPVLEKQNIPYCVFIGENFIGKQGYLSENQMKQLAQSSRCTIGFHSKRHLMLRKLDSAAVEAELSTAAIEKSLGKKAYYFAFPYGSLYACGFKKAKQARGKFIYSFSTVSAKCTRFWITHFPYYLPRMNVNESNRLTVLERLI